MSFLPGLQYVMCGGSWGACQRSYIGGEEGFGANSERSRCICCADLFCNHDEGGEVTVVVIEDVAFLVHELEVEYIKFAQWWVEWSVCLIHGSCVGTEVVQKDL